MKNKTGIIVGSAFGIAGFLLMFKFTFLDHIPPSDELAPGIVMLASIFNGFLFALVGGMIQSRLGKKSSSTEPRNVEIR